MDSNYPPGVSGNEWQIVGLEIPEPDVRACSSPDVVQVVPEASARTRAEEIEEAARKGDAPRVLELTEALGYFMDDAQGVTDYACSWEGKVVDYEYDGAGGWRWRCPVCGAQNEMEE